MKAALVILLAILLVGSLLVIAAETHASQPPINHSPRSAHFGKPVFAHPGTSISLHDFSKHYAEFKANPTPKLIPQPGQHTLDGWKMPTDGQTKFGWRDKRNCHITCIMLSSATRSWEKQNKIWQSQSALTPPANANQAGQAYFSSSLSA